MSSKRPLTYDELVDIVANMSDVEFLSDDDNDDTEWELQSENVAGMLFWKKKPPKSKCIILL